MTASRWHRWQLTAPLAALSRPVRTTARPPGARRTAGPAAAAGAQGMVTSAGPAAAARAQETDRVSTPGPSQAQGGEGAGGPAGTTRPGTALDGLPVLLGDARARQVDATTCGSAVLVLLAATGDPGLAEWLETGRVPTGARPPEIPADAGSRDAAERFAAAQRQVKQATTRRALGVLPWPGALGTPPWTAAREARFPGVRYRVHPVDDASSDAAAILDLVEAAGRRGQPVPLYVGGDLRGGVAQAVPRHMVLAVPPAPGASLPGALGVYEPAQGSMFSVQRAELLGRTTPHPALGGWTHVVAALLPVPDPLTPRCAAMREAPHWSPRQRERLTMSTSPNQTPVTGNDQVDDPEAAVDELDPDTGEDYDPAEVVDSDREASEADQVEQAMEVPGEGAPEPEGDGPGR